MRSSARTVLRMRPLLRQRFCAIILRLDPSAVLIVSHSALGYRTGILASDPLIQATVGTTLAIPGAVPSGTTKSTR